MNTEYETSEVLSSEEEEMNTGTVHSTTYNTSMITEEPIIVVRNPAAKVRSY